MFLSELALNPRLSGVEDVGTQADTNPTRHIRCDVYVQLTKRMLHILIEELFTSN